MKLKFIYASGLMLALNSVTASATLVNNGNGFIYDTTLNVTWTQDANLLGSLEGAYKSSSYNSLVNAIIDANHGLIYDYQFGGRYDPYYHLSTGDFSSNGTVDWWGAKAFVNYLNTQNYGGSNQWHLPYFNGVWGFNQTDTNLGELFYTELHGTAGNAMPTGPFKHIANDGYYYLPGGDSSMFSAWGFDPRNGNQRLTTSWDYNYVWAVSPGNVSSVPEPSTFGLLCAALTGYLGLNYRSLKQKLK